MSTIIPCYLALTAAEFTKTEILPQKCAYMACHFSCYGTGLSNLPDELPAGSMIILNDRTPIGRHDPEHIAFQMLALAEKFSPDGVLLDFQRPDVPLSAEVVKTLIDALPCPVGATLPYAQDLSCPVFLAPPPLHTPLTDYIAPFKGREIWLELATETACYIINKDGCIIKPENCNLPEPVFTDEKAFCRYHIEIKEDRAEFTLERSEKEILHMLSQEGVIARGIGLYQQLQNMPVE